MEGQSGIYWAAIVGAFAFLIVDFFDDGALWNVLCVACIVIAMLARPGGFRGRRRA
jgi:hypothetical protein